MYKTLVKPVKSNICILLFHYKHIGFWSNYLLWLDFEYYFYRVHSTVNAHEKHDAMKKMVLLIAAGYLHPICEWTSYQGTPKATSQAKLSFQQFTASSHTSKSRKKGQDVDYNNFRCCIQHHTLREIQFIKTEAASSLPYPVFDILGIYAGKTKFL